MPRPHLTRLSTTIYRDKSASDDRQVPASATVGLYRQGATLTVGFTVNSGGIPFDPVTIQDIGQIQVGDTLDVFSIADEELKGYTLTVLSIPNDGRVEFKNDGAQTASGAVGDRLVPKNDRPQAHQSPFGTDTPGSSVSTDSDTGRAGAFVQPLRYDYVVTGPSLDSRLFIDQIGGWVRSPLAWINVLDYGSIQDAVDAVPPDGGVVYIPGNVEPYDQDTIPSYTPPLELPADRAVHLLGDGAFRTYLKVAATETDTDMLLMGGDHQTVEGVMLIGPGSAGSGRGIVMWRTGDYEIPHQGSDATNLVYRTEVRDCRIQETASWGLYVDDATRNSEEQGSVWAMFDNVEVRETAQDGCVYVAAGKTTTQHFKNCNFKDFKGFGVRIKSTGGVSLIDTIIENSFDVSNGKPYVSIEGSVVISLINCWFEGKVFNSNGIPDSFYIETSGFAPRGITIDSCFFFRSYSIFDPSTINPKVILIRSGAKNVAIRNPTILIANPKPAGGDNHIEIESNVEAVIEGGVLSDVNGVGVPRIKDLGGSSGESGTIWLNAGSRFRLPRLTIDQRNALADVDDGDMVWVVDPNTSGQNLQIWQNGIWMAVTLESLT